jgi:hypothetical protein
MNAAIFNRHEFRWSKIAEKHSYITSYCMKYSIIAILLIASLSLKSQVRDAIYSNRVQTVQLYPYGNQLAYPIIKLNSEDRLELHFDDLDGNVKNYYYTFQLCDADWTPAMLSTFDYISGFSQQRLTTYRNSSIAFTRYTHYQATLPDRNCKPSRSGNYILKVYLNGDTTQLAFTKRMLVVDDKASISAAIQQPFSGQIFRTHQKIQFRVNLTDQLNIVNQFQQVKVAILQNNRWDNAVFNLRPTFFSRNRLEYNTETDAVFPSGKEWRWLDLRSYRFLSDRIERANKQSNSTDIFVKPDADRSSQRFNFFRDNNGMFTIETTESINPLWQTDYATVYFTYVPPDKVPYANKDVFLFGALSNYNIDDSAKMEFNKATGVYEKTLFLKNGYYDYCYVTVDKNDKNRQASFDFTEGNYWESENTYTILVYYRPLAGRSDELVAVTQVNSLSGRKQIF